MGGHLALLLAERGRADSVVALAPAGGWAAGDSAAEEALRLTERTAELILGLSLRGPTG